MSLSLSLALVAVLVPEYDEAIAFFCDTLGFSLLEDTDMGNDKRWVRVGRPDDTTQFLLARAIGPQRDHIGRQGGGRVWLFLHTDDLMRDHTALSAKGLRFEEEPRHEPYGSVAVFRDPFGNRWDLIEPRQPA